MKEKFRSSIYLEVIVLIIYISEFLILYRGDIPPSLPGYVLRYRSFIESQFNVITYSGALTSNIYLMEIPFRYILGQLNFTTFSLVVYFLFSTYGSFVSARYFIRKYLSYQYKQLPVSNIVPFSIGALYPLNYYIFGGLGFYSMFYATIPISLMLFDRFIPQSRHSSIRYMLLSGLLLAVGMSVSIYETRTEVYVPLIYALFTIYVLIAERRSISISRTLMATSLGVAFLMILNIRTILLTIYIAESGGISILSNATSTQLGLAYQIFPISYVLSASILWNGVYNPSIYYIGFVPMILSVLTLFNKNTRKISIFFLLLELIIILFVGTSYGYDIRYHLGQSSLNSILPILYPTYVVSILFVPLMFIPFSLGLFLFVSTLIEHTKKLNNKPIILISSNFLNKSLSPKKLKLVVAYSNGRKPLKEIIALFLFLSLILSPIAYFDSGNVESTEIGLKTVNVPNYIYTAESIINRNDTGIVYVLGESNAISNSLESNLTISPLWFSYISAYPQYLIENNVSDLAKTLSLLGVQYILLYNQSNSLVHYFNEKNGLSLVYSERQIDLFYNTYYSSLDITHTGVYIGYNYPVILNEVARSNISSPVIPFYDIRNFSAIGPYVKGFIGLNVSYNDVVPLLSGAYCYNFTGVYVDQYPVGWQQVPLFWAGDTITGIMPRSNDNLTVNFDSVSNGYYYVYVEAGIAALNSYYTSGSSVLNISSATNLSIQINESNYAPVVKPFYGGLMKVTDSKIRFNATVKNGIPMINKIYLIPAVKYAGIVNESKYILYTHTIYSYADTISINESSSLLNGDTARWYLTVPENFTYLNTINISAEYSSSPNRNVTGINYALSGIETSDNGGSIFDFYPNLNCISDVVNNTRYFSSYSQSVGQGSVGRVSVSGVKYGDERATFLPAYPKIGSLVLWTNKSFGNNITVNLRIMSTDFGDNPGISIDGILMDFSGRLDGLYPNYYPFSLKDNVWYNVYVSISGREIYLYLYQGTGNDLAFSIQYNLNTYNNTPIDYPVGIRSDTGNLYFADMKILNYPIINASELKPMLFSSTNVNSVALIRETNNTVIPITFKFDKSVSISYIENLKFLINGKVVKSYLSSVNGSMASIKNMNYNSTSGTEVLSFDGHYFVQSAFVQEMRITNEVFTTGSYYGTAYIYITSDHNFSFDPEVRANLGLSLTTYNGIGALLLIIPVIFLYYKKKIINIIFHKSNYS